MNAFFQTKYDLSEEEIKIIKSKLPEEIVRECKECKEINYPEIDRIVFWKIEENNKRRLSQDLILKCKSCQFSNHYKFYAPNKIIDNLIPYPERFIKWLNK